jgi:hypothetical protein
LPIFLDGAPAYVYILGGVFNSPTSRGCWWEAQKEETMPAAKKPAAKKKVAAKKPAKKKK